MTVYKRQGSENYSYDFRLDGSRYSGFTGTSNLDEALEFEAAIKADIHSASSQFCRAILRRARTGVDASVRKTVRGYVYMLRSGYFIKIGHSLDPLERLKTISTSTPEGAELMFYLPGSIQIERRLHAEFAACHYRREWFFLCGKLKRFIEDFERSKCDALTNLTANPPREIGKERLTA